MVKSVKLYSLALESHFGVREVVSLLRSDDFDMGPEGSNGNVASVDDRLLSIKFPINTDSEKTIDEIERMWVDRNGVYQNYFKDEYQVSLKKVSGHVVKKALRGFPMYYELKFEIR